MGFAPGGPVRGYARGLPCGFFPAGGFLPTLPLGARFASNGREAPALSFNPASCAGLCFLYLYYGGPREEDAPPPKLFFADGLRPPLLFFPPPALAFFKTPP